MKEFILENETYIRVFIFILTLAVIAFYEYKHPKRTLLISKTIRWLNNLSLVFISSILIKLLFPLAAFGVAYYMEAKSFGLLHLFELSYFIKVLIAVILLDLIIYWQHRIFHKVDFFWKFHKVHHSDMDFDLSTGIRFHPIEIIFSMLIKICFITILGAPALAVLIFEILLNSCSIFNHSNIKLPYKIDKILRYFIITPDFHRVHHSIHNDELNSNFGFSLSLWDRIFDSYTKSPKDGYDKMTIGLKEYQNKKGNIFIYDLIKMPFIR